MMVTRVYKALSPFKETSIAPLIVFRIIFGSLMLFGSIRFILKGWIEQLYVEPKYFFGYLGFEWIKPFEGDLIYLPFILMVISSVFIIFGFFYRISAFILFICFTYVELLDKSNYLNHYYFICLISLIMIFVPANRNFSIDIKIWPKIKSSLTKIWCINILKFQIAVVYFFAGIAKLNSDWLAEAQPMNTWLQAHHNIPFFGSFMQEEWVAYLFSWAGCIYDLFIVIFLLSSKYRPYAYFTVVCFHLLTWYLFPIGVFPWVMIFFTLIFFSDSFHEKFLDFFTKKKWRAIIQFNNPFSINKKIVKTFLIVYISIQILVPFRYLLYPGDLFWNEEGFRFSWRVMLMHKEGLATFYLIDPKTGRKSEIDNGNFLTRTQEDQMATQPDMILQYANILKNHYHGKNLHYGDQKFLIEDPEIHAEVFVSLNGRPSQLFVDKKHDLTKFKYNLYHRKWIEPFQE